ncbi:hypothetical protein ABH307_00735 [Acinetobacter pittii]|uniref:hypothetical protein n=1 Tax=Acinetobacter pittii TaxID=48296 RepID=UPI003260EB47
MIIKGIVFVFCMIALTCTVLVSDTTHLLKASLLIGFSVLIFNVTFIIDQYIKLKEKYNKLEESKSFNESFELEDI